MSAPDRYFYIIEEENNTKYMHLEGNIYQNEDIFKLNEWTDCCIEITDLKNHIKNDTFYEFIDSTVKYIDTIPCSDPAEIDRYYNNYFSGKTCSKLDLDNINENTPCGYYYFERN